MTLRINYAPLFHLLQEKKITQKELWEAANISGTSRQNLRENRCMTTDVLLRICNYLGCGMDDILKLERY